MKKLMRPLSILTLAISLFVAGKTMAAANNAVLVVNQKYGGPLVITGNSKVPFDIIKNNGTCYVGSKSQVIALVQNTIDLQNSQGGGRYEMQYKIISVSDAYQSGVNDNIFEITLSRKKAGYSPEKDAAYISECSRQPNG